jgi:hypothetical protein
MRVRALSPTGDYTFGNGALNFLIDIPEAVGQIVQTSTLLWLGEWYLDTTQGMPWIQGVLGKHNQSTADITVQDFILNITGVTDVQNFESAADTVNRKYSASLDIDTVYGTTPVQIANQTLF